MASPLYFCTLLMLSLRVNLQTFCNVRNCVMMKTTNLPLTLDSPTLTCMLCLCVSLYDCVCWRTRAEPGRWQEKFPHITHFLKLRKSETVVFPQVVNLLKSFSMNSSFLWHDYYLLISLCIFVCSSGNRNVIIKSVLHNDYQTFILN